MRHTVRRVSRGVEQAGMRLRPALRAAHIPGPGAASEATPTPSSGISTTRICHKVPEPTADSAP
ncbi:hypothetical protein C1N81_26390 [Streptomyces sp. SGAir0957]